MRVMLENDVLPIVNENDTVSITELMFTDNDELSGLITKMMKSDMLIILSNVDGMYDGNPCDESSHLIPVISPEEDVSNYVQKKKSINILLIKYCLLLLNMLMKMEIN